MTEAADKRVYCALNLVIDDLEVKSTVIYSCILVSLCRDVFLTLLIFDQEDLFILLDLCCVCSVVVGRSCSIGWGRWLGFYSNNGVIRGLVMSRVRLLTGLGILSVACEGAQA